jgi:hypothetical protein
MPLLVSFQFLVQSDRIQHNVAHAVRRSSRDNFVSQYAAERG